MEFSTRRLAKQAALGIVPAWMPGCLYAWMPGSSLSNRSSFHSCLRAFKPLYAYFLRHQILPHSASSGVADDDCLRLWCSASSSLLQSLQTPGFSNAWLREAFRSACAQVPSIPLTYLCLAHHDLFPLLLPYSLRHHRGNRYVANGSQPFFAQTWALRIYPK